MPQPVLVKRLRNWPSHDDGRLDDVLPDVTGPVGVPLVGGVPPLKTGPDPVPPVPSPVPSNSGDGDVTNCGEAPMSPSNCEKVAGI